jgi:hypothetical protein
LIGETGRLEPLAMAAELRSPLVAIGKPGHRPETSGASRAFTLSGSPHEETQAPPEANEAEAGMLKQFTAATI